MLCSIKMFEESERLHPVQEEETIKVEKIRGHIVFIGTEDDTLWNAAKYIRRMDERLKTHAHSCTYDVCVRPYGIHFCFPESMLKMMLPFGKIRVGLLLPLRKAPRKGMRANKKGH